MCGRIDGIDRSVGTGEIQHAVDFDRRGFQARFTRQVEVPGQADADRS